MLPGEWLHDLRSFFAARVFVCACLRVCVSVYLCICVCAFVILFVGVGLREAKGKLKGHQTEATFSGVTPSLSSRVPLLG